MKQSHSRNKEKRFKERGRQKQSKIFNAVFIGFLVGVFLFGIVSWGISPDKRLGNLIPMFIPPILIFGLIRNSRKNN